MHTLKCEWLYDTQPTDISYEKVFSFLIADIMITYSKKYFHTKAVMQLIKG